MKNFYKQVAILRDLKGLPIAVMEISELTSADQLNALKATAVKNYTAQNAENQKAIEERKSSIKQDYVVFSAELKDENGKELEKLEEILAEYKKTQEEFNNETTKSIEEFEESVKKQINALANAVKTFIDK